MEPIETIDSKVKDMLQATRLAAVNTKRVSHYNFLDGRVAAFEQVLREIAEIKGEYIPGYCQGCVRIEMSKLEYGQEFYKFKVVDSEHCDGCTEGESFAECPNNCAEWKGTPRPSTGEYCSCECHT